MTESMGAIFWDRLLAADVQPVLAGDGQGDIRARILVDLDAAKISIVRT
jgi:hypothetical protein